MKKVIALLGVVLFSASAFALNAVAPADQACEGKKAAFEKKVASQDNDVFIVENILINMADPMAKQSDEQALEQAICYGTFQVKGQSLVAFVRANAEIFPGDISGIEAARLRTFADRVERLGVQAQLNKVVAQGNLSYTIQYILGNFADPMANMSDEEAKPLAKIYQGCKVNGQPMVEFTRVHASEFGENVSQDLDAFVERVEKLAK
ncbi:MAG: hypothetical protein J6Q05_04000 [Elusimicrobiaceae bacterium]|nr:hypothetical protein [Elusimicrobiaceae bacterium]